jgi:hypothetical protein
VEARGAYFEASNRKGNYFFGNFLPYQWEGSLYKWELQGGISQKERIG